MIRKNSDLDKAKNQPPRQQLAGIVEKEQGWETQESYHRPNETWTETPIATVGTETGKLEVVAVKTRSLRSKRRIFTLALTAFTIGALLIVGASPFRHEFFVPGELTSAHGRIMAKDGVDRCANCHVASESGWLVTSAETAHPPGTTQSELCMKCHDDSLNAEFYLNPHNLAHEKLAALGAGDSAGGDVLKKLGHLTGMSGCKPALACSVCHQEHHGAGHDLSTYTDRQCQTCHQSGFQAFDDGHPEFVSYPLKERSGIAFDHASHSLKHFPGKDAEFNCSQCHIDDDFQNVKKLASFEDTCASCHNPQITEASTKGLAMFALPMLDTNAIEGNDLKIGSWPLAATGDFDGPLPPIMRVLLSADPKSKLILEQFGPNFEFGDVDPDSPNDVRGAVGLVWGIKRLLQDLSVEGPLAIEKRLAATLYN